MKPSSRKSFFRRLLGQQRGSVTPLFLLSFTAILGTTLGGVDLVRYNVVQNRLQSALDGATLSAGRNLQNRQTTAMNDTESTEYLSWQDDAFGYFRSNMPENYLGNTIEPEDLTISYSDTPLEQDGYTTGQFVSMRVEGTLPLVSTGFLQVSSMKVVAENRAVRHTPADIELVMALDNTGSMTGSTSSCTRNCGKTQSKMDALITAATDLSTVLFAARDDVADGETPRDITIGLVPFADTVNVGNTAKTRQWLYDYPSAQQYFIENNWLGCIAEPLPEHWGGRDLPASALSPSAEFMPLHLTYSFVLNGRAKSGKNGTTNDLGLGNNETILANTSSKTQPTGFLAPTRTQDRQYDRRVKAVRTGDTQFTIYSAANPSNCKASRKSLFLSNNQTAVQNAINNMVADGNTIIPAGLLWAWRMLDPVWQGAWDNSDKPQATNTKALRKVVVLLTDGENQPSTTSSSVNNSNKSAFRLNYDTRTCNSNGNNCSNATKTYTSPNGGYDSGSVGSQGPMNSLKMRNPETGESNTSIGWGNNTRINRDSTDSYLAALCEEVKNDGNAIKIYTVTLGQLDDDTEDMMNACSSGAGYYYNTHNSGDLPKVFQSIAAAMVELRLTK